jgi:hypothetical protein
MNKDNSDQNYKPQTKELEVGEDEKSESQEEMNDELQIVDRENLSRQMRESNVHEETKINKSEINKSETAMEVHHPHHPTHKKKFGEYLLEFFMLFLAVFLGFVAENVRESIADRQKEKEYILGMVQNLKDDTAQLHQVMPMLTLELKTLDSLIHLSKAELTAQENLKALGRFSNHTVYCFQFKSDDATITQLKSGNLRLIQTDHVADSLLRYDYTTAMTEGQHQSMVKVYDDYIATNEEVYDIASSFDTTYTRNRVNPPITTDKKILRLYFNRASIFYYAANYYLTLLEIQEKHAIGLIEYLQKEYHLD